MASVITACAGTLDTTRSWMCPDPDGEIVECPGLKPAPGRGEVPPEPPRGLALYADDLAKPPAPAEPGAAATIMVARLDFEIDIDRQAHCQLLVENPLWESGQLYFEPTAHLVEDWVERITLRWRERAQKRAQKQAEKRAP